VAEQNERWYAQLSYTTCNLGLASQSGLLLGKDR
jgi:hypothetical protein